MAYLIAQESETEDDMVLQVKVQLAAVMAVGGLEMFDFEESLDGPEPADTLEAVIRACTGYSTSLGDEGSIWLALGLWNRVGKDSINFSQVPDSDLVSILGTSVRADWSRCVKAHEHWKSLSSALVTNGIDTVRKDLTAETLVLSIHDKNVIDNHLLKAYLSQLVVRSPGQDDFEFLDVSTRRTVTGCVFEAGITLDFDNMLPRDETLFGIYQHLVRVDGKVYFGDWTRVLPWNVRDWIVRNPDRSGQYEAVIESMDKNEKTLPRPNYDEYN